MASTPVPAIHPDALRIRQLTVFAGPGYCRFQNQTVNRPHFSNLIMTRTSQLKNEIFLRFRSEKNLATFAERIRSLRGERQSKEFAKAAGISAGALSAYENGISMPTSRILARISERMEVSVAWLLSGEETTPPQETEKVPTSALLESDQNRQHTENTTALKNKSADVGTFGDRGVSAPGLAATPPQETEKPATVAGFADSQNSQPIEIATLGEESPATSQVFSQKLDQALDMIQQLQARMLALMDRQNALLDKQSALQDESAALREERAELKAENKALQGELCRLKSGDAGLFSAPAASAAPEGGPGSERGPGPGGLAPGETPPPLREAWPMRGAEESDKGK